MQVYSVLCFVVRTVRKFDFRFVTNDTPNKMSTSGKKKIMSDRKSGFDRTYFFFSPVPFSLMLRDSTEALQVNCVLLGKRN